MQYEQKNWKKIVEEKDEEIQKLKDIIQQKWNPCSEKLPPEPLFEESYLIQESHIDTPYTAYWDGEKWTDSDMVVLKNVIAWMELPERYRPKKRKE